MVLRRGSRIVRNRVQGARELLRPGMETLPRSLSRVTILMPSSQDAHPDFVDEVCFDPPIVPICVNAISLYS